MSITQVLKTVIICALLHDMTVDGQVIIKHPSSLLIPVNEIGNFTCICNSCLGHWVINNSHIEHGSLELKKMGFTFENKSGSESKKIYTLTVNASESINNTVIYCDFEPRGDNIDHSVASMNATLLVLSSSPISPNPSIEKNCTHLSLLWSPPFLWPGQRIHYYNISFVNKSDGSIMYYRVKSTFRDQVVKFTMMFRQNDSEMYTSSEIEFCIFAFNISGYLLPSYNISYLITPSPPFDIQSSNWSADINITFFKNDTTQVFIVDFEVNPHLTVATQLLPTLKCPSLYEELNYTLMVYNERRELVTQFGPVEYRVQDSSSVKQRFEYPNIEENQFYSLTVQVATYTQIFTSNEHVFNTSYPEMGQTEYTADATTTHTATGTALTGKNDTEAPEVPTTTNTFISSYKIVIGICLSVIAILLLVLMIMIVCVTHLCSHRFKRRAYIAGEKRRSKDTKARACNNMVHNPIYAGLSTPIYDSIWPLANTFDENHNSTANHRSYSTTTTNTTASTTGKTALHGLSEYGPSTARQKDSYFW